LFVVPDKVTCRVPHAPLLKLGGHLPRIEFPRQMDSCWTLA
jgi:hypothetical protein